MTTHTLPYRDCLTAHLPFLCFCPPESAAELLKQTDDVKTLRREENSGTARTYPPLTGGIPLPGGRPRNEALHHSEGVLSDQMEPHPHNVEVKALLRIAALSDAAIACSGATADVQIDSI